MALKRQLVDGVVWVGLGVYISRAISGVKLVILARILSPLDFGVMGIALSVISAFNLFANLGIKPTLVQYNKEIEPALITGFWLNLVISFIIGILCFVLAYPISNFANAPRSIAPIQVLAWMMMIDGLGIVPAAILERRMAFKYRSFCDILMSVAGLAVALSLALSGWGLWSLIWSQIASSVILTGSLFIASGWFPKGRPNRVVASELIAYGRYILGDSLASFVNQSLDTLSLASLRTTVEVGLYGVAYRLSSYSVEVVGILNQVTFPAFTRLQDQQEQLNDLLFRVNRYTAMIASAIASYTFLFGPLIIKVMLGDQWIGAIVPFQLLSFLGFFRSMNRNFGSALTATGAAKLTLQSTIRNSIVLVFILPTFIYFWGAIGAAIALAVYGLFSFIIVLRYVKQHLGISAKMIILNSMVLPIGAALLAGGTASLFLLVPFSDLFRLIICTIGFGIILLIAWYFLLPDDFRIARKMVASRFSKTSF